VALVDNEMEREGGILCSTWCSFDLEAVFRVGNNVVRLASLHWDTACRHFILGMELSSLVVE
jgi:hypothetical protein